MATAAEAIERVALVAGRRPSTVERPARALRDARLGLWPLGKPGGGRAGAALVNARHMANLLIALAASDTHAEAPEAAEQFGRLELWPAQADLRRDARLEPILGAARTFGDALTALIETIARDPAAIVPLFGMLIRVDRADVDAVIETEGGRQGAGYLYRPAQAQAPLPLEDDSGPAARRQGPIKVVATLPLALVEAAADLVRDTLATTQPKLFGGAAPTPSNDEAPPGGTGRASEAEPPAVASAGLDGGDPTAAARPRRERRAGRGDAQATIATAGEPHARRRRSAGAAAP